MSRNADLSHTIYDEKAFINRIGTFSEVSRTLTTKQMLMKYKEALLKRADQQSFSISQAVNHINARIREEDRKSNENFLGE